MSPAVRNTFGHVDLRVASMMAEALPFQGPPRRAGRPLAESGRPW